MATADVTPHESASSQASAARDRRRGRAREWVARVPTPLKILLTVAALQSIAWNVATPAFQGPDESAHFAYVQYFAETGHTPSVSTPAPQGAKKLQGVSTEHQEALRVLNLLQLITNSISRPAWSAPDLSLWHRVERGLPHGARTNGAGPNPIAKNPPLYYAVMSVPYRVFVWLPLLKRVFVLRLFNALFYLATIALVWLIAGELFGPVRWKQTLAAGAVALEPLFAFMSAVINPDSLLILLTTAFLFAALRLVRRGPSVARVLAPSALAAGAVLTHGRGLATLPVLGVALLVAWIKYRPAIRETVTLAAAAAAPVGAAFLVYTLFGRGAGSSAVYGGQVAELTNKAGFKLGQFLSGVWDFYFAKFASLPEHLVPKYGKYGYRLLFIEQYYGDFGSLDVALPKHLADFMQGISAVGILGFLAAVVARWRALIRAWPAVVVLVAFLVTTIGFLHYVDYRALLNNGATYPLVVGRYLLPMIALFGLAIAFTVGALRDRAGALVGGAILGFGSVLSLTAMGLTLWRFYG
jgi:4-amino-4-deoxy-L-arabinose transferase-like glycosyltransferase